VTTDALPDTPPPLLAVNNVEVIYDHVILVLKGVSLAVPEGGIVALLGANGAGKSTTLKAISGLLRTERGEVTKGSMDFLGSPLRRKDPSDVVKLGIVQVMEGRHVFEHLTVEENLLTGAYTQRDGRAVRGDLEKVYAYFPRLRERRGVGAGYVSGGEQQMVAIGRGLMSSPRVLMLDEPSLGLAPILVDEVLDTVRRLKTQGITILLVEQNVREALDLADRGYVLQTGRIVTEGTGQELLQSDLFRSAFLGV
jgi:branched-chain amino acid transport system ATP-binding protein